MEKKKWKKKKNKACREVIMYCYTSCGNAKWLEKKNPFKMGAQKNKSLLNLCTYERFYFSLKA